MAVVEQKIILPLGGIIYLAALFIVIFSYLSKLDFGVIGIISWIIVIVGAFYFIILVIGKLKGY
jgi:hypothetical protein